MKIVNIIKALTPTLAIVIIAALEAIALSKGIDGVALAAAIALIAGLGGYKAKDIISKVIKK